MSRELISVTPLPVFPVLVNPPSVLWAPSLDHFTWLEGKRMDTALAMKRVDYDIAVVQANRDVSVARISANRDVSVARIQADRDITVTRLQAHRDVALAHASVSCQWLNDRGDQKHLRIYSDGEINQRTRIDTW